MVPSEMERLRECRILGMLTGVAAVIGLWLYFVQEIFRATEGARLILGINLIGGALVLGMLLILVMGGALAGLKAGEGIIYPVRTGNDAVAKRRMLWILAVGLALAFVATLAVWFLS